MSKHKNANVIGGCNTFSAKVLSSIVWVRVGQRGEKLGYPRPVGTLRLCVAGIIVGELLKHMFDYSVWNNDHSHLLLYSAVCTLE